MQVGKPFVPGVLAVHAGSWVEAVSLLRRLAVSREISGAPAHPPRTVLERRCVPFPYSRRPAAVPRWHQDVEDVPMTH